MIHVRKTFVTFSGGPVDSCVWLSRVGIASALWVSACSPSSEPGPAEAPPSTLGKAEQALRGTAHSAEPSPPSRDAEPADDYTLFEVGAVRPVARLAESGLVVVTNTVDDYLEVLTPRGEHRLERCGAIKVGMRPVAVSVISEKKARALVWVVNHLSDSVSVVRLDTESCDGEVVRTLPVGDEPRDIVVARNHSGHGRVFISTAHRGQRHPVASARSAADLTTPASEKQNAGLADVFVFDPDDPTEPLQVVNLFTDTPRALAVGDGVVYAAGFHTGNRTTAVIAERVVARGMASLAPLLARDSNGNPVERDGELVLGEGKRGVAQIAGGNAAVRGSGRCLPDPRYQGFESLQQLCVQTDARHRVERIVIQEEGSVDPDCQCTSGDGTLQPTSSVIARFYGRRRDCGGHYTEFPDGSRGCWLDAAPGGAATPAVGSAKQAPPMDWNEDIGLSLPDTDVFAIDVDSLETVRSYRSVGTILYGMAVQPGTGRVFVTNTEAQNLTRFEGPGESASTSVIGHLHESRVTVIDAKRGTVRPMHLNDHIDYSRCCEREKDENEKSFAFPTSIAFSPDGQHVYFTALGSDKLGIARANAFDGPFEQDRARAAGDLREVTLGHGSAEPSGPIGLEVDPESGLVYVKTHFSNELVVVDPRRARITDRVALPTPEPPSITLGRHILYNARLTSSHGDSACGSCHVFGDFDSLSWDLGDPDGVTVRNPGPFATPVEIGALRGILRDPLGRPSAFPGSAPAP